MTDGYPTLEQVERADVDQLLGWNRFLPSPKREEHIPILERIVARLAVEREKAPSAYVAASKRLGW